MIRIRAGPIPPNPSWRDEQCTCMHLYLYRQKTHLYLVSVHNAELIPTTLHEHWHIIQEEWSQDQQYHTEPFHDHGWGMVWIYEPGFPGHGSTNWFRLLTWLVGKWEREVGKCDRRTSKFFSSSIHLYELKLICIIFIYKIQLASSLQK
jgi:hypothetical protein